MRASSTASKSLGKGILTAYQKRTLTATRSGRYHDDKKKSTTDEHIETLLIAAENTL